MWNYFSILWAIFWFGVFVYVFIKNYKSKKKEYSELEEYRFKEKRKKQLRSWLLTEEHEIC